MSRPLPAHGPCYVCGPENPGGLGLTLVAQDDGRIETQAVLGDGSQGPPGFAHGGCLSAILDEVMGAAAWRQGHRVMAVRLEVDFRAPTPLGTPIAFVGWCDPAAPGARKVHTHAEARLPDGRVSAQARGVFAQAPAGVAEVLARKLSGAWS